MQEEPKEEEPKPRRRGIRWFFCCGAPPGERKTRERKPKRERRERAHRRRHRHRTPGAATPVKAASNNARSDLCQTSILSDEDWHDVQDAFSVGEDGHSPLGSIPASPRGSVDSPTRGDSRRAGAGDAAAGAGGGVRGASSTGSFSSGYEDEEEASSTFSEGEGGPGIAGRFVSCLAVMRHDLSLTGDEPAIKSPKGAAVRGPRPPAGCTLQRRPPGDDPSECRTCWDECDATAYQIRSIDYMRTKVKVSSSKSIYRLAAIDIFRTDAKAFHVARLVHLPPARDPVVVGDVALPPLLIFNVQLPQYPAAFFGNADGVGQSIVYYFTLPEDFDPETFENQAALGLLARFVANGREADGSPTRERLKMIVRCCNAEEWAASAPLSATEYKLLVNYNEKPVLTRPQHFFFVGPNYLEVDMDVHAYAYLARKALNSYHSRLKGVVWDNAFVLQGNAVDELPEQVLGCGRIYRTDFEEARPLSDFAASGPASGVHSGVHSRAPSAFLDGGAAGAGGSRSASPAGTAGGGGGGAVPGTASAAGATAAGLAAAAELAAVAEEAGLKAAPAAVVAQAGA